MKINLEDGHESSRGKGGGQGNFGKGALAGFRLLPDWSGKCRFLENVFGQRGKGGVQ